jgi:hypothetical protein
MLNHSLSGPESEISAGPARIAYSIEQVLRSGGTRSELRELVDRFADLARVIGFSLDDALARLDDVATRAASVMASSSDTAAVGESVADRRAMMARWCSARYQRAD